MRGILAAFLVAAAVLWLRGFSPGPATPIVRFAHVPEDPSGPLETIAIHYAPTFDEMALPTWQALFAVLPARVRVQVAVARREDFARFQAQLATWGTPHRERFSPVVVGRPITTWSRDRFAALQAPDPATRATGVILAPPRIEVPFAGRAGDAASPAAIAEALGQGAPRIADFVFEGGDLVSTPRWLFVDANLQARNLGRSAASRDALTRALRKHVTQEIVWLGDEVGEVPRHHIMMYATPLDDRTVVVGDVHAGLALLAQSGPAGATLPVDPDGETHAGRFNRAAELLAARGFDVVRLPVVVLEGAASYVTYTNALFDREGDRRVVYLPTYALPVLDKAAARTYQELGFIVRPIDVSHLYQHNGSLGCLVNIIARG